MPEGKTCTKCKLWKTYDRFAKCKSTKDGKQSWCKGCTSVACKQYAINNRERAQAFAKDRRDRNYGSFKGRAKHMLVEARHRAKAFSVDYALTLDWLLPKLENGVCEQTGLPFQFLIKTGKGHRTNSFAPSLDRIDPTGPYTPENVQVVVWIYNRAKGAFPVEDFYTMCRKVVERIGS